MTQELLTRPTLAWHFTPLTDLQAPDALLREVPGLHPLIAEILCKRGAHNHQRVKDFLTPGLHALEQLPPMLDLNKAVERVRQAIESGEKILVYGDYDVDGICSTAMVYSFLRKLNATVDTYNPDRYTEGYGISKAGVEYAAANGYSLVLALDCGIVAVDRIAEARALGIDFIVCDHHLPGETLPPAFAILNPKQPSCGLYGEELCGCGVAFMLLRGLSAALALPDEAWLEHLPLVAVATCCDIVDLTGLNRSLVKAGLEALHLNPPPGIAAMLQLASFTGTAEVSDVVFKIGPRINAAGRLAHARLAVELLIQPDLASALPLARQLEQLNLDRRALDKAITTDAEAQMRANDPELSRHTTVVRSADWHKGVIGIVASRLTEVCYRPTIVFTEIGGELTGSARSVDGFDLFAAIKACAPLLNQFGGHHSAAGLSLPAERYGDFCESFEKAAAASIGTHSRQPGLHIDVETDFDQWHNERFGTFYNQLNRLRPFGPKNNEPLFATRGCKANDVRVVGTEHIKFKASQQGAHVQEFNVIAFGMGSLYTELSAGRPFDMVYTMGSNHWNGISTFQLEAKDIRLL